MKRLVVGILAAAVLVSMPRTTTAQTKTFTASEKTESGTVEAIEAQSRTVTIKKPDGTFVTVVAGPEVKRFAELKVGDKITARFYENLVLRLKQPGEADVNSASKAVTPAVQELPGATKAKQRTITATITNIDMNTPSITFTAASGWKYTSRVLDKEALAKVKVGDKVDLTWTEAVLVSLDR